MTQRKQVFNLVENILSSVSKDKSFGMRAAFAFGRPGDLEFNKNFGAEIYYNINILNQSALRLRDIGPEYYKYVDVSVIRAHLQEFLREHFCYISEDVLFSESYFTFDKIVSYKNKEQLVDSALNSKLFKPRNYIFLYPVCTIEVTELIKFESFFFSEPESLSDLIYNDFPVSEFDGRSFPPFTTKKFRKEKPVSWIGVFAPFEEIADRRLSVILGSVSLLYSLDRRNLKSGRSVFGGRCRLGDGYTFSFGPAHTPPNFDNVEIGIKDTGWLAILDQILRSGEKKDRRNQRALQYFYRVWGLPKSERFPILCINLDSIFSEASGHRKSITEGVRLCLGNDISEKKVEKLLDIRGTVIHGGAPDVYDTKKYSKYFKICRSDPILDLEFVVQEALKRRIFSGLISDRF